VWSLLKVYDERKFATVLFHYSASGRCLIVFKKLFDECRKCLSYFMGSIGTLVMGRADVQLAE
jgi:hypothetical protein